MDVQSRTIDVGILGKETFLMENAYPYMVCFIKSQDHVSWTPPLSLRMSPDPVVSSLHALLLFLISFLRHPWVWFTRLLDVVMRRSPVSNGHIYSMYTRLYATIDASLHASSMIIALFFERAQSLALDTLAHVSDSTRTTISLAHQHVLPVRRRIFCFSCTIPLLSPQHRQFLAHSVTIPARARPPMPTDTTILDACTNMYISRLLLYVLVCYSIKCYDLPA